MMTKEKFFSALGERAKSFKAAGTNPPVIRRWEGTTETAEWGAWVKYWRAIGAASILKMIEDRQSWTVPTPYPWEFDIDYHG